MQNSDIQLHFKQYDVKYLYFLETALAGDIWKHAINMPKKANLQNWTTIQQVQSMNIH